MKNILKYSFLLYCFILAVNTIAQPVINVNPLTLSANLFGCNDSVTQTILIKNTGDTELHFQSETSFDNVPTGYCIPTYSYNCSSDDYINNFSFGDISNLNSGCNGEANNYIFVANQTTHVMLGNTYTMTMQAGSSYSQGFGVWIDYNQDGDFEDVGEFIYASPNASKDMFTTNITIPSNAKAGKTMLRVRCRYNGTISAAQYCSSLTYGETEDYAISIAYSEIIPNPAAGSILPGDSVNVEVKFKSAGLNTGIHTGTITINSDDPVTPSVVVSCTLIVTGIPNIAIASDCIHFGTFFQFDSATDSILISNNGCGNLEITNIVNTNNYFSPNTTTITIPPGQSEALLVNFNPLTEGTFNDTLVVTNNDSTIKICLSGTATGPPVLSVNPESFNVTINACNDSVTLPFTISNPGEATLSWNTVPTSTNKSLNFIGGNNITVSEGTGIPSGNQITVEAWVYPTSLPDASYNGIVSWGYRSCTGNSFVLALTNDGHPSFSTWCNDFIPSFGPTLTLNTWNYVAAVLDSQNVTVYLNDYSWTYTLSSMPDVYGGYMRIGSTDTWGRYFYGNIDELRIWDYARSPQEIEEYRYKSLNPAFPNLAAYWNFNTGSGAIISDLTGNGHTGSISNQTWSSQSAPLIETISLSSNAGSVPLGSSQIIDVTFHSTNLVTGTYQNSIIIQSNDPLLSADTIPYTITYNGYPEMTVSDNCLHFDTIFQYSTISDTLTFYNTGCDTLKITNITNNTNNFSTNFSSLNIAPGFSDFFTVSYSPTTVGNHFDTLLIQNNDSNIKICLYGHALYPPSISYTPFSISETINVCNDSVTVPITIFNSGNQDLIWSISPGTTSISDNFDQNINWNLWSEITLGVPSNGCGSYSGGNALYFDGDGIRQAATNDLNTSLGGTIDFYLLLGSGSFPCEQADGGEGIELQYSINGGTSWTTFASFDAGTHLVFTSEQISIPSAARTASTRFRWTQPSHSGSECDNWAIDNISINNMNNNISFVPASGVVSFGNNSTINATFYTDNLINGVYQGNIIILSNDPLSLSDTIPYTLTYNGYPVISPSANCITFDPVMQWLTISESITISNTGCDTLKISDINNNTAHFSVIDTAFTILPGNSVDLVVAFHPVSIGNLTDTLYVSNNDADIKICLNGEALSPPIISFTPSSFNVDVPCDDTLVNTLTIHNTGGGILNWSASSSSAGVNPSGYCYPTMYSSNSCSYLNSVTTNGGITNISNPDGAGFNGNIAPGMSYFPTASVSMASGGSFMLNLQAQGSCNNAYFSVWIDWNQNAIFDASEKIINSYNAGNNPSSFNVNVPLNVLTGTTRMRIVCWATSSTAGSCSNLNSYYGETEDYNVNILSVNLTPSSGIINPSENQNVNVVFDARGMSAGAYSLNIYVLSDDPLHPVDTIPCTMNVFGNPEIATSHNCLDFDTIMQWTSNSQTLKIYNTGCDTLKITDIANELSVFSVNNTTLNILPWDSASITVTYLPSSTSHHYDTLEIFSNASNIEVCLHGYTFSPPVQTHVPDSIHTVITTCNDTVVIPLFIHNTGDTTLQYYITAKQYLNFNGTNSYVRIDHPTHFDLQDFTYSVWINANATDGYRTIIDIDNDEQSLFILNGQYNVYARCGYNSHGTVTPGWHHVAWAVSGSSYKLFVDGIQIGSGNNCSASVNADRLMVGAGCCYNEFFDGKIKEVSVWNIALTESEVTAIMNNPPLGNESGLIGYWPFIQEDENTAIDMSVYGNHGTMSGAEWELSQAWINLSETVGEIPENSSDTVYVTLSAQNMITGTYNTTLLIYSNDPLLQMDTLPVTMVIEGSPVISTSDICLEFDSIMQWTSKNDTLVISNTGCDTLNIADINNNTAHYIVSDTLFSLLPGSSVNLIVTFNPFVTGEINDTLYIFNNDSNIKICLHGKSLSPPVISCTPEFFTVDVPCGDTLVSTLTIHNTGGGELIWEGNGNISGASPTGYCYPNMYSSNSCSYLNSVTTSGGTTNISNPSGAGFNGNIAPGVSYFPESFVSQSPGGSFILTLQAQGSCNNAYYSAWIDWNQNAIFDGNEKIVSSYNAGNNLVNFTVNVPTNAVSGTTRMRIVCWANSSVISSCDNLNSYYGETEDYLVSVFAMGLTPSSGIVNPYEEQDVLITFDGRNLNAGVYPFNIFIFSNDPLHNVDTIPCVMNVIGDPIISSSVNCIEFDSIMQWSSTDEILKIYNTGCDTLFISGITNNTSAYSFVNNPFYLLPGDSIQITITFNPEISGLILDTLHILNNASVLNVCLNGYSISPPVISTNPTSLVESLYCCDSTIKTITVYNTGDNDLIFNINKNESYVTFDGVNDYIRIENTYNGLNKLTVETWIYPTSVTGLHYVISNGRDCCTPTGGFNMYFSGTNLGGQVWRSSGSQLISANSSPGIIEINKWQHIAMVYDGTQIKLFKNGVLVASSSVYLNSSVLNGSNNLHFGVLAYSVPSYYDYVGYMDNIRLWNTAKNQVQIFSEMNNSLQGNEAGLIGYWNFENNSANDLTSNNNHGTLFGNCAYVNYPADTTAILSEWMTVWPINDTISPADSATISVKFNGCGLTVGNYNADIFVSTNDPLHSIVTIPCSLSITGSPVIQASVGCLEMDSIFMFLTTSDSLWIYNTGCDTLNVTDISTSNSVYTSSLTTLSLLPGDSASITVIFNPVTTSGLISDTLVLTGNAGILKICLNGYAYEPPVLSYNPTSISAVINDCNDSLVVPFYISNSGDTTLTWNLNTPPENIVLDIASGSISSGDSDTVNITFYSNNLLSGNYNIPFIISSNDPLNSFDTIPCTLTINGYPLLSLSDTCLQFDTIMQWQTTSETLTLTNTGCDTMFVSNINATEANFNLSETSFSILPGSSADLTITFYPLDVNTFNANLIISGNFTSDTVCLNGVSTYPPIITVNPLSFDTTVTACNDTVEIPLYIKNTGNHPLSYSVNAVSGLSFTNSSGTVATDDSSLVIAHFDAVASDTGLNAFTVTIASNDPLTPSVDVNLNISVTPKPNAPIVQNAAICFGDDVPDLSATGTNIQWYDDAELTNLIYSGSVFSSDATSVGIYTYYATQTIDGCESFSDTVSLVINAIPDAPVGSDLTVCYGNPDATLSATGSNITWFNDVALTNIIHTGNSYDTGLSSVGSASFYITQTIAGCTGPHDTITFTINPIPDSPVVNDEFTCFGDFVPLLTATGDNIQWYDDANLTTMLYAGASFNTNETESGIYQYFATQTDNVYSCESQPVTVQLNIFLPENPVSNDTASCFGSATPDLTTTGTNVQWYDDGTLTNLVNTGNTFATGLTSVGSYTYYLTQTDAAHNCVSLADTVTINIYANPSQPSASDDSICYESVTPDLIATGNNVIWYSDALLTTIVHTGNVLDTNITDVGTYTFYTTQTINNCVSNADTVVLVINPIPDAPVVSDTIICSGQTSPELSATGTNINWYSDAALNDFLASGNTYTPTVSAQAVYHFYATQTISGTNCEGHSSEITLTIDSLLPAPTVADAAICLGENTQAFNTTGDSIRWYSDFALTNLIHEGNNYTSTETLSGVYTYYLTQNNHCGESALDSATLTIFAIPEAPEGNDLTVCYGTTNISLTASGSDIVWYSDSLLTVVAGNGNSYPAGMTNVGIYYYYPTQNSNGCESPADTVTLEILSIPDTPISQDTVICFGIPTPVLMTTGANPEWYTEPELINLVHTGNNFITGITAVGTYTYYIVDVNSSQNCNSFTDSVTLTINDIPLVPTFTNQTSCFGQNVPDLTATGNNIVWYSTPDLLTIVGTENVFSTGNTAVGEYEYYLTQTVNNCQSPFGTISLSIFELPDAPLANDTNSCSGGIIPDLIATGNDVHWYSDITLTSLLHTGNSFASGEINTGIYTYYITQIHPVNGCEGPHAEISLSIDSLPGAPVITDISVCHGVSVPDFTAIGDTVHWYNDGGLSNLIHTGNVFASGETAVGMYTYYATQSNLCGESAADTATLIIHSIPSAPSVSDEDVCFNQPVPNLTATGANLTWYSDFAMTDTIYTGATFNTGETAAGIYTYYVSETANGCESPVSAVTLSIFALPPKPIADDVAVCNSAAVPDLIATGNNIIWYDATFTNPVHSGNTFATGETAVGTYTYYATQSDAVTNCVSLPDTIILQIDPPLAAPIADNLVLCYGGGNADLTATGVNINWYSDSLLTDLIYSGNNFVTGITNVGTYTFYATQQNTCGESVSDSVSLTINPQPAAPVAINDTICFGEPIPSFTTTGNFIIWFADTLLTTPIDTGLTYTPESVVPGIHIYYFHDVDTATGCASQTANVALHVNDIPAPPVTQDTSACYGSAIPDLIVSGMNVQWYSDSMGVNLINTGNTYTTNQTQPGVYSYYVSQSNECGEGLPDSIKLIINEKPQAPIGSDYNICEGDNNPNILVTGQNVTWYSDSALTTIINNGTNYTPVETMPGSYICYLINENSTTGCISDITEIAFTINTIPAAPVVSDTSVCSGLQNPAILASGISVIWYSDSLLQTNIGTGNSYIPSVITPGVYTYYATQTVNGCEGTAASALFTIFAAPQAPIVSDVTVCSGESVPPFNATGTDVIWYSDSLLTNSVGIGNNFTSTDTASGVYTYYATQSANGCESAAAEAILTINDAAQAPASLDRSVCFGQMNPQLSASGINITWYSDSLLTNVIGTGNTYTPTGTLPGTYIFYATQSSALCGESNASPVIFNIFSAPQPPTTENVVVCFGIPVPYLTANGSNINWYTEEELVIHINFGNTFNTGFTNVGEYHYYITQTINGCTSQGAEVMLKINPAPLVTLNTTYVTIPYGSSVTLAAYNADTYTWSPPQGLNTTNGPVVIASPLANTVYTVTGTNQFGCSATTSCSVEIGTGIEEISFTQSLKVYPNPANNELIIEFITMKNEEVQFKLINQLNQTVLRKTIDANGETKTAFDLSEIANGVYHLQIINGKNSSNKKIVVKH